MNKKRLITSFTFVITILAVAIFLIWLFYYGYLRYNNHEEEDTRYVNAMSEDNFGGKSSEETLSFFVAALQNGDINLASKYFMLDHNLSREKWLKTLSIFQERGLLDEMARDIENNPSLISIELNKYSNVWKISGL